MSMNPRYHQSRALDAAHAEVRELREQNAFYVQQCGTVMAKLTQALAASATGTTGEAIASADAVESADGLEDGLADMVGLHVGTGINREIWTLNDPDNGSVVKIVYDMHRKLRATTAATEEHTPISGGLLHARAVPTGQRGNVHMEFRLLRGGRSEEVLPITARRAWVPVKLGL